jgi:pantoate--beta-alanine ligase
MFLVKTAIDLRVLVNNLKSENKKIGFVATMGALHQGHLALIQRSKSENDTTICSIFVNPRQFNDSSDLEKYPRPIDQDILKLESAGNDILFIPNPDDIYPDDFIDIPIDLGNFEHALEGKSRPGHFKGVATVVKRLFDLVTPDTAYFGQKDFQQTLVVKKIVDSLNLPIQLVICDIYREPNGLAMSSRNIRLTPQQREEAGFIYNELLHLKSLLGSKPLSEAVEIVGTDITNQHPVKLEYLVVVNKNTLQPIEDSSDYSNAVALIAVNFNGVRLLDNILL